MDGIDPRPVYEADQVIRMEDLIGIRNGIALRFNRTPFFDFNSRSILRVKISAIDEMIHWLAHGKPVDGVKPERDCKGEHNDQV